MRRTRARWEGTLALVLLARVAMASSLEVLPPDREDAPAREELGAWRRVGRGGPRWAEDLAPPEPLHVLRGGERARPLGERRVLWADRRLELVVAPEHGGRRRVAAVLDHRARRWWVAAGISAPSGGQPRLYLSDRDGLGAVTVDFERWDTCPVLLSLDGEGAHELRFPCPAAGRAALAALERRGLLEDPGASLPRFQLRLANLRYRDPSFLRAEELLLDAEVYLTEKDEVHPARFVLREGEVVRCRLRGEPGGPGG